MTKQARKPRKFLWKEWKASMHRSGPTLWQYRCGQTFGGPHGSKGARQLAKFLLQYANWVDFHENKRKRLKQDQRTYYNAIWMRK